MKLTHFAFIGLIVLVAAGVYLVLQNDNEGRMHEMQAEFDRKFQKQEQLLKDKLAAEAKLAAEKAKEQFTAAATASDKAIKGVGEELQNDPTVKSGLRKVKDAVGHTGADIADAPPTDLANAPSSLTPEEARIKRAEDDLLNSTGAGTGRVAIETGKLTGSLAEENSENLNELQSLILAQPRIARVADSRPAEKTGFIVLDEGLNKGMAKGDRFAVRRGTIIVARIVVNDNIQATQCVADILPNSIPAGMAIKNGDDIIKFDR